MVTVKITETYDMKTTVNKMGILGVHTPDISLIRRLYPGLLKSHKFIRFVKCDVVGACASVLPADPLQVGVSAGNVAPEDMFNPILYKAVTNESFDTLVSRVMLAYNQVPGAGSLFFENTTFNAFDVYYGLLAENGEYRKAMPQSGFKITNLVPICHTLISNYGNLAPPQNVTVSDTDENAVDIPDLANVVYAKADYSDNMENYLGVVFRGKPVRMPKQPIHYGVENWDDIPEPNLVKTMVLALIVPPAKLNEFYYRVRVTWTVRFENVCSTLTAGNGTAMGNVGRVSHGQNYSFAKSEQSLDNQTSSVDATNLDINKIMES